MPFLHRWRGWTSVPPCSEEEKPIRDAGIETPRIVAGEMVNYLTKMQL